MSLPDTLTPCDCDVPHDDIIHYLQGIVDETCAYHDRYFESHSIEQAINKYNDVKGLVDNNIKIFDKHEKLALESNKAYYSYLRGKLLNVPRTYSSESERLLSKAIKLDPSIVDAWNELGECYSKNDISKARSCFEGALREKRNKISLRNLSIIVRMEASKSRDDLQKNVEQGLNYAKEAVQMDPQDGISWAILGNAHLSHFFKVHQNPNTLKQCLSAYAIAEKDVVAKASPDLHFNKATTLQYQEEFKLALESYNESSLYDPTFDQPQKQEVHLLNYLQSIQDLVRAKGKLKPKKVQQLLQSINSKDLGPYGGGSYTSSTTNEKVLLTEIAYDDLKPGVNEEKVILGKVICSVRNESSVPFTFCSIDKQGSVIVTTVFNLADGKGVIIGDSVAIPEPYLTDIDFSYKTSNFRFRLVRVEYPVIMVVNGKKVGKDVQAGVQMSILRQFD